MRYIIVFVLGGIGLLIAHLIVINIIDNATNFSTTLSYFGLGIFMCWIDSKL